MERMVAALSQGEIVEPEDFLAMGKRLIDELENEDPVDADEIIIFIAYALSLASRPS